MRGTEDPITLHNKQLMTKEKTSELKDTQEKPEEHTPLQESENLPIGKLLRQAREKKELTIHDISQETNISSSNLTSIELGNYDELPADTFIRGQIIIYAKFLGLDGKEAARLFFEERAQGLTGRERDPFRHHEKGLSTKQLAEPSHISSATWAVSLLVVIITFLIIFSWFTGWSPFAYFFKQESAAPTAIATAIAHPGPTEPAEAETLLRGTEEAKPSAPSAIKSVAAPTQEKSAADTGHTVQQDIASE